MGYRSDVALMAVFANAEQHDEVMAVYRMMPLVQAHRCAEEWRRVDMPEGHAVLIFEGSGLKWYESYEDVQGLTCLEELLSMFREKRGFASAWGYVRVGEDQNDVVYEVDGDTDEVEIIHDRLSIHSSISIDL